MKKLLALALSLLIACTAFACLVSATAADETTTKDPYETDIPQVITNIAGGHSADHQEDLHNGLKFFRILTENLTNFFKDIADAFDHFIDRWKAFSVDGLFNRLSGTIKG